MLFMPERHEALTATPWDEAAAMDGLREIVGDIVRQRCAPGSWPGHPSDHEGADLRDGHGSVYLGSAGVLWALWLLERAGAATSGIDIAADLRAAHEAYLARPDTGEVVPSYFLGEVGILFARWQVGRDAVVADRLHAAVQANIANPTNEALWAAPGTMLAAWHLWQATREARWRELFLANVEQLWRTWQPEAALGCHLWTQHLYGYILQYYGAGHGCAGNLFPLLEGAALLDDERREELYRRTVQTLKLTARIEDGAVSWPPGHDAKRPDPKMLMQWCHGAPGIVTALAPFPVGRSAELEALLLGAGEAVWRAGPLTKGHGLCHGTAGNGYAFLALHRRTGDALWLDRARRFAMHALAQYQAQRRRDGRGRYTLWTGDAGLAVYLWHCVAAAHDGALGIGLPALACVA